MTAEKRKHYGEGSNVNNTDGASEKRAKRNRYISIACNQCKRRKIKCNGNTPCQRCGNLNLECQYAPNCCSNGFKESEEFRQMNLQINSLQEQVNNLFENLNAMRNGNSLDFQTRMEGPSSTSHSNIQAICPVGRHRTEPKHPAFRGPTSSAFSLDVAKNTLHSMGYAGLDDDMPAQEVSPAGSPTILDQSVGHREARRRDVLLELSHDEVVRLCRVYDEEIGTLYPILDLEELITHVKNLYTWISTVSNTNLVSKNHHKSNITDDQTCVLKMVVAVSLLLEGNGESELGYRLFESVRENADRSLHGESLELKRLPFLVLVAMFHYHCDEEALAWRIIGQVARMCLELGLHRRDYLFRIVKDEKDRQSVIRLFWCIYVLDRRWSFGTGMPFALQEADIDPNLPEPVRQPHREMSISYLSVMIGFSRIGSKVWKSINSYLPALSPSLNIEDIGYLDYQVIQWQKAIPQELQLPTTALPQSTSRAMHRLQILLYLRANQMRTVIYRPVLHSASSIQDNLNYATVVVDLAKDTIRALTHLNQTTDIYKAQQVSFNYFLISALAVIFLASCHAPVHFSSQCREEFYMALDLVKGFSKKSFVNKRLWRTIRGLKEIGPKLGLSQETNHTSNACIEDAHSSAALAMAGLAGHDLSLNNYDGLTGGNSSSPDGYQMSNEMTNLFEMALGTVGMNGNAGTQINSYAPLPEGDTLGIGSNVFSSDEDFYRQMQDLF
ncbi:fungal-specific transcription factor domain protein [Calycina marina]|uniref:Fungal-specific transcription factor domain protein n=1 Tax=Calycina marina TaxID=1763456 RepID=A0A9P8CGE5_9HELO|nr:fungal-specific transcription factor domain protein [Calycina marina]